MHHLQRRRFDANLQRGTRPQQLGDKLEDNNDFVTLAWCHNDCALFDQLSAFQLRPGRVALGNFSPRAPADPCVRTLAHTVPLMTASPCSKLPRTAILGR